MRLPVSLSEHLRFGDAILSMNGIDDSGPKMGKEGLALKIGEKCSHLRLND